ncbi:MAG: hypothetical protein V3V10_02065, partial [Planctomycetota bacterium]
FVAIIWKRNFPRSIRLFSRLLKKRFSIALQSRERFFGSDLPKKETSYLSDQLSATGGPLFLCCVPRRFFKSRSVDSLSGVVSFWSVIIR